MQNQFFYKKLFKAPKAAEGEQQLPDITKYDSFSLDKVIRSVWVNPDAYLVLLDDGHEDSRVEQVPKFLKGKVVGVEQIKSPKQYLQSEVYLDAEDAERFRWASEVAESKQIGFLERVKDKPKEANYELGKPPEEEKRLEKLVDTEIGNGLKTSPQELEELETTTKTYKPL